jgi:hypothetical protein
LGIKNRVQFLGSRQDGRNFWGAKNSYLAPMARPSKIQKFTEALEKVLATDHSVGYAIIYTDLDIVEMVNEMLDPEDRISQRRFEAYKAGGVDDDASLDVFRRLYKGALRQQSSNLFERLSTEPPGAWQKWAWIIERKFDDWNMRAKVVDESPAPKQLVFVKKGPEE